MRNDPVFSWSDDGDAEKLPVPPHLVRFIENYENDAIEFGFDVHGHAEEMLDAIRDHYPELNDVELANLAISNSF